MQQLRPCRCAQLAAVGCGIGLGEEKGGQIHVELYPAKDVEEASLDRGFSEDGFKEELHD